MDVNEDALFADRPCMTVAKGKAGVNDIRNYESRSELSPVVGAQQAIRTKHYLEDRSSMQLSSGSFNIGGGRLGQIGHICISLRTIIRADAMTLSLSP
jgi:hypothetical protein